MPLLSSWGTDGRASTQLAWLRLRQLEGKCMGAGVTGQDGGLRWTPHTVGAKAPLGFCRLQRQASPFRQPCKQAPRALSARRKPGGCRSKLRSKAYCTSAYTQLVTDVFWRLWSWPRNKQKQHGVPRASLPVTDIPGPAVRRHLDRPVLLQCSKVRAQRPPSVSLGAVPSP